jgi:hypothetical protein
MRLLIASATAVLVLAFGAIGTADGAAQFRKCKSGAGQAYSKVEAKRVSCRTARRLAGKHALNCAAKKKCRIGRWTCRARLRGNVRRVRCVNRRKVVKFVYPDHR